MKDCEAANISSHSSHACCLNEAIHLRVSKKSTAAGMRTARETEEEEEGSGVRGASSRTGSSAVVIGHGAKDGMERTAWEGRQG